MTLEQLLYCSSGLCTEDVPFFFVRTSKHVEQCACMLLQALFLSEKLLDAAMACVCLRFTSLFVFHIFLVVGVLKKLRCCSSARLFYELPFVHCFSDVH